MLWRIVCRNARCMWFVMDGLKHAETLVWSFADRDRRSSFSDSTEGDKHLSHRQMLFVCCDVHVTALWWPSEALQADVHPRFVASYYTVVLCYSCMYGDMALLPFPSLFTACVTCPMKHLLLLFPSVNSLTFSTHYPVVFLPSWRSPSP